jgi:hypothetical protein
MAHILPILSILLMSFPPFVFLCALSVLCGEFPPPLLALIRVYTWPVCCFFPFRPFSFFLTYGLFFRGSRPRPATGSSVPLITIISRTEVAGRRKRWPASTWFGAFSRGLSSMISSTRLLL